MSRKSSRRRKTGQHKPGVPSSSALNQKADQLFLARRYQEALALYDTLLASNTRDPHLHANRATCLLELGEFQLAIEGLEQSLALYPKNPSALNNLAALRARMGELNEALVHFQQLDRIAPNDPIVWTNIGMVLNRLKRQDEAVDWFNRALVALPRFADAWMGLASARAEIGRLDLAQEAAGRAAAAAPGLPGPRLMQAVYCLPAMVTAERNGVAVQADFALAIGELAAWARADPHHLESLGEIVGDRQPFLLAYRPGNHRAALSAYGDLMARAARAYWQRRGLVPVPPPPARSRIRLGILNEQIRRHSVWDIILKGLVKHLDRTRFELVLYHSGLLSDEETRWAEQQADRFVGGPKGHAEWLRLIRDDALDVLFLPEIGMDTLTCKLAALRLAPLQVASWGHPITSGLPEIDLYCSGELLEPPEAQDHYRERLIRLPGTGACTEALVESPVPLPDGWLAPAPEGSDMPVVRLLICQRPFKCDPGDDALIAQVARVCAPCQIYLLRDVQMPWASDALKARLGAALTAEGLDPETVLIERKWLTRGAFFSLLEAADIYLDLPAFSGYTTAWQALHRGIPILTLEGEFLRQRLAAGLLRRVGLTDTIASSRADYVAIAARLAEECRDPEQRARRRERIRAAAPQADHDTRVVRAFETALIDGLAERGRVFDFAALNPEENSMTETPATPFAPQVASLFGEAPAPTTAPAEPAPKAPRHPWQLLDEGVHLHTLSADYAPIGLLQMIDPAPKRVLDVGCFCGATGRWLKQQHPGCAVIGIEMLEAAAEKAAAVYDRVIVNSFEQVDFAAEGLQPGSVDVMVAADVLEHLFDPWKALQRLRPLLAPGGALYISLPNVRNLNVLAALARGEWRYQGAGILDITHLRFFTRAQAIEMLNQTGWTVDEIRINPDPGLMNQFQGQDLSQIKNINAGTLTLTDLKHDDVLELLALQLFIRARVGA